MKEIDPSSELRNWFKHDPNNWGSPIEKHQIELNSKPKIITMIFNLEADCGVITFFDEAKMRIVTMHWL